MPSLFFSDSVVAVLAGVNVLTLVWVIALTVFVRRIQAARERAGAVLRDEPDSLQVLGAAVDNIERLTVENERLKAVDARHRGILEETVRHVGVVRFDAFREVGGRLSFAVAFLNERGDGVVITSINGRSDSRVYAKPIVERRSEFALSEEEEESIRQAYQGVKT